MMDSRDASICGGELEDGRIRVASSCGDTDCDRINVYYARPGKGFWESCGCGDKYYVSGQRVGLAELTRITQEAGGYDGELESDDEWEEQFKTGKWQYVGPNDRWRGGVYVYSRTQGDVFMEDPLNGTHAFIAKGSDHWARIDDEDPSLDSKFQKSDRTKPELSLVPYSLSMAVARVLEHGYKVQGYDRNNWRNATQEDEPGIRDAVLRHATNYNDARERGEEGLDKDSGLSELWHLAAQVAFLIDLAERGKK